MQNTIAVRTALLTFQITAFMVPWLVVLWLSFQGDVTAVAQYSFLLALFSPMALLIASPSRNFLISTALYSFRQAIGIRYMLMAAGAVVALACGITFGQIALALAVYFSKVTEFSFDIGIARYIREGAARKLLLHGAAKLAAIFVAAAVAWFSGSLLLTLCTVGMAFPVFALRRDVLRPSLPDSPLNAVKRVLTLSMSALIFSVYFNIPRYLLGADGQSGLLAIFTISSFVLTVLLMVNNALCQADLHRWSGDYQRNNHKGLKREITHAVVRGMLLYVCLQVLHISSVFDGFWAAHNNLHLQNPAYPLVFSLVISLSFGPLLFSLGNYLLIVQQRHRRLLFYTLCNAVLTGAACLLLYRLSGFISVIYMISLSGVGHFILCSMSFLKALNRQ